MFITTYLPGEGRRQRQSRTPERCAELLTQAIGERIDIHIIEVASWQPYSGWPINSSAGECFSSATPLAIPPPFKAGGANTAIKVRRSGIEVHVSTGAQPALLSAYQAERHPDRAINADRSPAIARALRLDNNRPQIPHIEASMLALLARL